MAHSNMLLRNPRFLVLNDDHRATDSPSIACDVHCSMMVVDVNAHELAEPASSTETSEGVNEAVRKACEANDCSVDVDNEGVWAINLGSRCEAYV